MNRVGAKNVGAQKFKEPMAKMPKMKTTMKHVVKQSSAIKKPNIKGQK